MENLKIRQAMPADLNEIEQVYASARKFMAENGNPSQWGNTHPRREILEKDIALQNLYVVTKDQEILGVFYFVIGIDPTYAHIENGSWRSNSTYGTIHRIASRGSGVFGACVEFCRSKCSHIRVDTHADNNPMQHLAEKFGFSRRGIIYVEDGTPRIAYDLV